MGGRIFGLKGRSINLVDPATPSHASKTGPTRSTTTSATRSERVYTLEEAERMAEKMAEGMSKRLATEAMTQLGEQHRANMDAVHRLFKDLYDKSDLQHPQFPVSLPLNCWKSFYYPSMIKQGHHHNLIYNLFEIQTGHL